MGNFKFGYFINRDLQNVLFVRLAIRAMEEYAFERFQVFQCLLRLLAPDRLHMDDHVNRMQLVIQRHDVFKIPLEYLVFVRLGIRVMVLGRLDAKDLIVHTMYAHPIHA